MIKKVISFSRPQVDYLGQEANRLGISYADLVRRIVDEHRQRPEARLRQRDLVDLRDFEPGTYVPEEVGGITITNSTSPYVVGCGCVPHGTEGGTYKGVGSEGWEDGEDMANWNERNE